MPVKDRQEFFRKECARFAKCLKRQKSVLQTSAACMTHVQQRIVCTRFMFSYFYRSVTNICRIDFLFKPSRIFARKNFKWISRNYLAIKSFFDGTAINQGKRKVRIFTFRVQTQQKMSMINEVQSAFIMLFS